jgi:hypothetical protein
VIDACPWCDEEYDLTPVTEPVHLASCPVFQTLPVAEVVNGKTFVRLPSDENILVERVRIQ